jgi:hypothetical protein
LKCTYCGAGISQEMKNCPYCGTGLNIPSGEVKPKIEIHLHSDLGNDPQAVEESHSCPKCKAKIPLSSINVAKRAPTIGQWILAGLLGLCFYFSFRLPVEANDSAVLVVKILFILAFGYLLGSLLWVMFTRKVWICPACRKVIKVKRYWTKFQQNKY